MSNRYSHYVWECLSQSVLNEFCKTDGVRVLARHKWMHLSQAAGFLKMSPKQIHAEGFRDFLIIRTNDFFYNWDRYHLDGIIHPDAVMVHAGALIQDKVKGELLKELAKSGLPTDLDLALFDAVFSNPEVYHAQIRKASRLHEGKGYMPNPTFLPKTPYNGFQARQQGLWWKESGPKGAKAFEGGEFGDSMPAEVEKAHQIDEPLKVVD